jgi:hypothetical protein
MLHESIKIVPIAAQFFMWHVRFQHFADGNLRYSLLSHSI